MIVLIIIENFRFVKSFDIIVLLIFLLIFYTFISGLYMQIPKVTERSFSTGAPCAPGEVIPPAPLHTAIDYLAGLQKRVSRDGSVDWHIIIGERQDHHDMLKWRRVNKKRPTDSYADVKVRGKSCRNRLCLSSKWQRPETCFLQTHFCLHNIYANQGRTVCWRQKYKKKKKLFRIEQKILYKKDLLKMLCLH